MDFACIGKSVKWDCTTNDLPTINIKTDQTGWCETFVIGSSNKANPLVRLTIKWFTNIKNGSTEEALLKYVFEEEYILDMTDLVNENDRLERLLDESFKRNTKEFAKQKGDRLRTTFLNNIPSAPLIENMKTLFRGIGY